MKKPIYCSLAFGSVSINSEREYIPCCNIQHQKWPRIKNSDQQNILFYRPRDRINAFNLVDVRKQLIDGEWPEVCYNCKEAEENNVSSMRTIWNLVLGDNMPMVENVDPLDIKYLDLTFSTKCNSKCMTCHAEVSDFWEDEWTTIWIEEKHKYPIARICIDDFLAEKIAHDFPNVEKIALIGGEPMISTEHIKFLELLVKLGRSKNIGINYVTNLTGITDELIQIWKNFKAVHVNVSIDGYKRVNEYIRYPFKWSKTEDNLRKFLNMVSESLNNIDSTKFSIGLSCTVSLFNINYIADLFTFWYELLAEYGELVDGNSVAKSTGCFINRVTYPEYTLVSLLSNEFRQQGSIKLQQLLDRIKNDVEKNPGKEVNNGLIESIKLAKVWAEEPQIFDTNYIQTNKAFITKSDVFRNRHIKDFLPELYQELTTVWQKIPNE